MGLRLIVLLGLSLAGLFLFYLIGYGIAIPALDLDLATLTDFQNYRSIQAMKFVQALVTIGTFAVPAILFSFVYKGNPIQEYKLGGPRVDLLLVSGLMAISAIPFIGWFAEWNQGMQLPSFLSDIENWMRASEDQAAIITEAFLKVGTRPELIVNLIVIALLPAICEELLFRGALQGTILKFTHNAHLAIWLSAAIFSAIHMQFFGFFPRMLLGALFGYLVIWGGSLWYSILAHFINNGISVYIMYLIHKGSLGKEVETFGANDGDWFYVLISIVLVAVSVSFFKFLSLSKNTFRID